MASFRHHSERRNKYVHYVKNNSPYSTQKNLAQTSDFVLTGFAHELWTLKDARQPDLILTLF